MPLEYEIVSYQAVQVPDSLLSSSSRTNSNNKPGINDSNHISPNLGIWDCRMLHGAHGEKLLSRVLSDAVLRLDGDADGNGSNVPTFVLTLDMEDPSSIHSSVERMVRVIKAFCYGGEESSSNNNKKEKGADNNDSDCETPKLMKGSTFLTTLKSTKFGIALSETPKEEEKGGEEQESKAIEEGSVNIILCAILPKSFISFDDNTTNSMTYREKQAQYLVSYHLQKYAAELNCTLCFVRTREAEDEERGDKNDNYGGEGGGVGEEKDDIAEKKKKEDGSNDEVVGNAAVLEMIPIGMPVEELSMVLKRVSSRRWDDVVDSSTSSEDGDDINNKKEERLMPSMYAPDSYDKELINSVFLRNASCPGVWDASKDCLWVALRGNTEMATASKSSADSNIAGKGARAVSLGDENWLGKLAESVSSLTGGVGIVGADNASVKSGKSAKSGSIKSRSTSGKSPMSKRPDKKKRPATKVGNKDVANFFEDLLKK